MSRENVELVQAGYTAWNAGGMAAVQDLMDPDVVFDVEGQAQGVYRGHEGMLESYVDWTEDFDDFKIVAEEFLDTGDYVVVRTRQTGTGKSSRILVEGLFWFVFQVRDGKVVRIQVLNSEQAALEAAGLRE